MARVLGRWVLKIPALDSRHEFFLYSQQRIRCQEKGRRTKTDVCVLRTKRNKTVAKSVYKIIELVGTSRTSWEEAARNAVETFARKMDDLRIAEIVKLDMTIDKDKVIFYRARVKVSSKIKEGSHLFLPSFEE